MNVKSSFSVNLVKVDDLLVAGRSLLFVSFLVNRLKSLFPMENVGLTNFSIFYFFNRHVASDANLLVVESSPIELLH